ncbi:hypothetical protein AB0K60_13290 [Thermopolyspora sp. NPDC052614]|uniref:hypothetical protein n=1 Tax=Thermopolyspora sp. NPDC052614 TaxID=3155682 RepID=UPI003439226F
MTVVINEMDMVPGEPGPEFASAAAAPAAEPSPARIERLVERLNRVRHARDERLRAY